MKLVALLLLIIYISVAPYCNCLKEIAADDFSKDFISDFKDYFETNVESSRLQAARAILLGQEEIKLKHFPKKANGKICLKCYSAAETILWYFKNIGFEDAASSKMFLTQLCKYIEIEKGRVCNGNVDMYFETIKYILENRQNLTADQTCGTVLQGFHCSVNENPYKGLLIEKPTLTESKKSESKSEGTLKILHFSDFHYDPLYVEGSNAKCEGWICCRGYKLLPNYTTRAGKWGDYRSCDNPSYQVENLIQEAAKTHTEIDAIYMTGDYSSHFAWDKTPEELEHSIEFIADRIKKYFPGVPVFPVLGNHDSYPDNLYAPNYVSDRKFSTKPVYEMVVKHWGDWLPENARLSFKTNGYYTTLLRPNLRIIALNSNVCFASNLWLLLDNFYFKEQLEWLAETLKRSSELNEKVHILSHVPSNDIHCYRSWTTEFHKIIERYSSVISAQFNGHSHVDEFVVFYANEDPSIALSVAWNGASGTNFPNVNSNYKIVYINDQSYEVVDFDTWIFNLTQANSNEFETPIWFKEYSFKSFYNLKDLSPFEMDSLVQKMKDDSMLLEKYWRFKVKLSDAALASGCGKQCLEDALKSITRTYFDNAKSMYTTT